MVILMVLIIAPHTHSNLTLHIFLLVVVVCWAPLRPRDREHGVAHIFSSLHYIITVLVFEIGRGPSLRKLL